MEQKLWPEQHVELLNLPIAQYSPDGFRNFVESLYAPRNSNSRKKKFFHGCIIERPKKAKVGTYQIVYLDKKIRFQYDKAKVYSDKQLLQFTKDLNCNASELKEYLSRKKFSLINS